MRFALRRVEPSDRFLAMRLPSLFDELAKDLAETDVIVEQVTVWESENACASYTAD